MKGCLRVSNDPERLGTRTGNVLLDFVTRKSQLEDVSKIASMTPTSTGSF